MAKIEIFSDEVERMTAEILYQVIRDLYPGGIEHFYSSPPELEQVVGDAIRYRYLRSKRSQCQDFDAAVDRLINEEIEGECSIIV